jgi:hypothetical protein
VQFAALLAANGHADFDLATDDSTPAAVAEAALRRADLVQVADDTT